MGRKDEAYQYLKHAIVTNELKPEQPISELLISEKLQMSRTPIREAMRELEREGLIVSYPSRGSFVSALSPYDVEEIYELRVLFETWALERSISRIPVEKLEQLEHKFLDGYQQGDWELLHDADRELHAMIVDNSGSRRLADFHSVLLSQIERIRHISSMDQKRRELSYREHMQILACIRERNPETACRALSSHLRSVADSAIEVARQGAR